MVFNFTDMRTNRSRDRIYRELFRFMYCYYGVSFEYE